MKHLVRWKARTITDNELVRDETIIDNEIREEAERVFYNQFDFNRYKNLRVTSIKGV